MLHRGDPARQSRWRAYATWRLAPVLARVGWQERDGEEVFVTVLRAEPRSRPWASLGDAATIAEARRRYALRASEPAAYPVALRKSILEVVARHADVAEWEALHAEARAESTPLIKDQLYRYLASARDEALARRALEVALLELTSPARPTRRRWSARSPKSTPTSPSTSTSRGASA